MLFVDDEPQLRQLARDILATHHVVIATTSLPHVEKPFDIERMRALVESLLG